MNARESFTAAEPFEPDAPTPLLRETPPGAPYPLDALGPLREAAEALHEVTQAPPAIGAQSLLGVAALAAQALADVETLHGIAPASLFLLTVAQSGERKSACDKLAMRAVRAFEAELAETEAAALTAWRNRHDVWEAARKDALARAKRDRAGAEADLAALGAEPEPPLYPTITAGEPTLEGIVKHMGRLRPALGLFTDEGGAFIGGHAMNADNRLKTVSGLSKLWDGSPVDRWRAGDGVAVFRGRRLSAHLMAQPVAAAGLLGDPVANGQGFLARFLIVEPHSAIGSRLRASGASRGAEAALARFEARVGAMLRQPPPVKDGTRNELAPPVLALSPGARALLQDFALAVEAAQAKGGALEAARPFASKAAEHAARLAAVLTLCADPDARAVTPETMADAAALAGFYCAEAARLADAATVSRETAEAEELRRWLLETWPEPFVSVRAIVNRGPNRLREATRARAAAQRLEAFDVLARVEGGAVVLDVKAREAWRVNRGGGR